MTNYLPELPDNQIVNRIRAGDTEVFGRLFKAYWAPLCTFVALLTRDQDEAREIIADLFAALWARRAEWTVTGSVQSYLFGAARNRARTARRDVTRHKELLQRHIGGADILLHGRPIVGEDTDIQNADLRITLERAVSELPPNYQAAIYLRWRRDLEYDEIAHILGTTHAAAKKLVSRAIVQLRGKMRNYPLA